MLDKMAVYRAYETWHGETQNRAAQPTPEGTFWRDLYQMTGGHMTTTRTRVEGERVRHVTFPTITTATSDAPPTFAYEFDWDLLNDAFESWLSK